MSELKICRICLRTQCKVYKYDRFQLKPYYEEVMAMKVNEKDGLPQYFCYECAATLQKFHKFKEKCYRGQQTLKEISWRGPITYEAVYKIDRAQHSLQSPLEILTVTKRVKTYVTTDASEVTESETESIHADDEIEISFKDIEENRQVFLEEPTITDNDDQFDTDAGHIEEEDSKNIDLVGENTDLLGENDNNEKAENVEHKLVLHKIEDDFDVPSSPTTVFVDIKKDVIVLEKEPIKERKNSQPEFGLKKQNPKHAKQKLKFLDSKNWKKLTLSEEEAVREFQMRSQSPKYQKAPFKCTDCIKGFSKEEMLKRHRALRHSELGPLECRFCRMRFKWDSQLRKHMRQHFNRYNCLHCDLICCLENTALLHEEVHKGIIKKCVHCGEEFRHSSTYYTHLRTHRSAYVCTLCGMSFVSPMGLHMHKKIKHISNEIESPDDDDEVNTYCDKCAIRFETRKAYEEHLFHSAMHIDENETIHNESAPRKLLAKKLQAKITGILKRKRPDEEITIGIPKKPRRGCRRNYKKPTTCHQCGKHFDTQAACMKHHLTEHPRTSFHAPNERHICEICGASLAPGSVAMHQNIHSRTKVHPCETCGRSFHSLAGLRRHLVTHTGEKPFACSLCDKKFTQSNSMKLHYRTFHLKQPYPKRNRRKRKDDPPNTPAGGSSESEASPAPAPPTPPPTVHYLTLS